jgi:hypothetical protein
VAVRTQMSKLKTRFPLATSRDCLFADDTSATVTYLHSLSHVILLLLSLVVRVLATDQEVPDSIPDATDFSEK